MAGVNEEHRITCSDNGSGDPTLEGFTFTFNGVTSNPILSDAVASRVDSGGDGTSVEEILEAMTMIGDVEVTFDGAGVSTACSTGGTVINVRYFTNLGNLDLADVNPAVSGSTAVAVAINGYVDGTKLSVECAGGGTCDRRTGKCTCFRNMVSSDGNNFRGLTGDCGAYDPLFRR